MAGAFKLAAGVAVLAVAGWVVAGRSGPDTRLYQAGAPSPSPSNLVGEDWAFFSGTTDYGGGTSAGPSRSYLDDGMVVDLGLTVEGQTMETDDPRMSGTRADVINLLSNSPDNSTGNIGSALVTVTNDAGAWTRPMTFIHTVTDRNAAGENEQWAGWCEGSGAYVGLKAYLAFRQPEDPASSGRWDVYGFISSGDGPPMPDAPAS